MRPHIHPEATFEEDSSSAELLQPERSARACKNWKLTLAYDGTDFHGWQVQPGHVTVQGAVAAALERICGEVVLPQGSGRTDTGVHALGQTASFALAAPIPPESLQRALNRTLPASIRILEARHAPADFHARHSAISKSYSYRIFRGEICPPTLARYVYALAWPLDVEAMQAAAAHVLGEHDFSSMAASDPDRTTRLLASMGAERASGKGGNTRILTQSEWRTDGDVLEYCVRGNGFLHHMVRNLVGTFLEVGRGQRSSGSIPPLLLSRNRTAAGPTAPARGLFLTHVEY